MNLHPTPHLSVGGSYPRWPRVAVGAVVFHNHAVLLVRRAKAPARGQWAIPGGSVKLGERLQEAAEREILEETGITVRAGDPIYTFDVVEADETNRVRFHYIIVDLAAEYVRGRVQAGDDALEARWVSARDLVGLDVNARTRRLLKQHYRFGD